MSVRPGDGRGAASPELSAGSLRRARHAMTVVRPAIGNVPFDRVIVGIDGSPAALEAGRQACRLAPGQPVALVSAVDVLSCPVPSGDVPALAHLMRDEALDALATARAELERAAGAGLIGAAPVTTVTEDGRPEDVLRYAAGGNVATLLAVGARGGGPARTLHDASPDGDARYEERVVIQILRAAPCSVLVGRMTADGEPFPRTITVGVDGSAAAMDAYAVGAQLAAVTGAELRCVVALGGKGADLLAVARAIPDAPLCSLDYRPPLDALVAASEVSDLVVVGRRHLRALRSLTSVSERLVARASSSVLVVRYA